MSHPDIDRMISASLLRLRMRSPFFATLALFARFRPREDMPTASTDGRDIFYNPDFLARLNTKQFDAVLLHEVLHAALLHVVRRGSRDAVLWNLAADIVVNGIIGKQNYLELIAGAIREPKLEDRPVEEIYELLSNRKDLSLENPCFVPGEEGLDGVLKRIAETEAYWRQALRQAEVVQRSTNEGRLPAGLERLLKDLSGPQIDWRAQLWRFLVKTPTDFSDFDRRFLGRGLYLEALEGESVRVFVAVDTSGSISNEQLSKFLGEVYGILGAYPHLEAELYYADAQIYGPYPLHRGDEIQKPVGGGGTSFVPFFEKIEEQRGYDAGAVCVYLTDGFGAFPEKIPDLPVLWVVTPGGLEEDKFPFGEVAKLLSDR